MDINRIAVLLVVIIIAVGTVNAALRYYADKIQFGAPWLQWLTFDEIVAIGCPSFFARILLPLFYRIGKVEIRISDKASELGRDWAERKGLLSTTAEFYEYKFTERWRRGKEKPVKRRMLIPQLLPV